jgi:tetratricopeptide (TPR) repeat protein
MADTARIEELRRRVQMDPASIAFAALAEEYRRARLLDDAIATCRTGLQRHPAYLSARVTLGRSLLEIGRFDEARQELEQVLRVAPENLAAIRALAEIHHRAGELPEGDHQFDSAEPHAVPDAPAAAAPQPPPQATLPASPPIAAAVPQPPAPAVPQVAAPTTPQAAAPTVPQTPAPVITSHAAPAARPPAPAARQPHPDEAALPALEAFLSAIVVARTSGNHVSN